MGSGKEGYQDAVPRDPAIMGVYKLGEFPSSVPEARCQIVSNNLIPYHIL